MKYRFPSGYANLNRTAKKSFDCVAKVEMLLNKCQGLKVHVMIGFEESL